MKKFKFLKLLPLLGVIGLSSCSFFFLNPYQLVNGDGSTEKQQLSYKASDIAKYSYADIDYTPSTGNPKLLFIPIWFTDSNEFLTSSKKEQLLTDINTVAFGDEISTGWHSVKSYFLEDSNGLLDFEGSVADWYDCGVSYKTVREVGDVKNIVNSAVNNWKSENPELVKDYDTDSNGFLDGVICIYACPSYQELPNPYKASLSNTMWAYTSWLGTNKNVNNPNPKQFIWASYSFIYNSDTAIKVDGHTIIHETGHLLGLDDYYDYNQAGCWAGAYSMQDYNVGGHDPYSKLALGWCKPYVPTESTRITIRPFAESGDVIMLTPRYTASPFDEYILVELYTPTGTNSYDCYHPYVLNGTSYPAGPTIAGLRIWHVDARLLKMNNTITTSISSGSRYMVANTNTTYVEGGNYNDYCSNVTSFIEKGYKLLELIRKGDYNHTEAASLYTLSAANLFRRGDVYSTSRYANYFRNNGKFDNGYTFDISITVDFASNSNATVTIEF